MIIDVNSIVSGWDYDILTSVVTKLLTSRPFGDLRRLFMYTQTQKNFLQIDTVDIWDLYNIGTCHTALFGNYYWYLKTACLFHEMPPVNITNKKRK